MGIRENRKKVISIEKYKIVQQPPIAEPIESFPFIKSFGSYLNISIF
jgi:hypothetical protein